jgi:hypothetical protein
MYTKIDENTIEETIENNIKYSRDDLERDIQSLTDEINSLSLQRSEKENLLKKIDELEVLETIDKL